MVFLQGTLFPPNSRGWCHIALHLILSSRSQEPSHHWIRRAHWINICQASSAGYPGFVGLSWDFEPSRTLKSVALNANTETLKPAELPNNSSRKDPSNRDSTPVVFFAGCNGGSRVAVQAAAADRTPNHWAETPNAQNRWIRPTLSYIIPGVGYLCLRRSWSCIRAFGFTWHLWYDSCNFSPNFIKVRLFSLCLKVCINSPRKLQNFDRSNSKPHIGANCPQSTSGIWTHWSNRNHLRQATMAAIAFEASAPQILKSSVYPCEAIRQPGMKKVQLGATVKILSS